MKYLHSNHLIILGILQRLQIEIKVKSTLKIHKIKNIVYLVIILWRVENVCNKQNIICNNLVFHADVPMKMTPKIALDYKMSKTTIYLLKCVCVGQTSEYTVNRVDKNKLFVRQIQCYAVNVRERILFVSRRDVINKMALFCVFVYALT